MERRVSEGHSEDLENQLNRRSHQLKQIASRSNKPKDVGKGISTSLVLTVPYSSELASLKVSRHFSRFVGYKYKMLIGWSVQQNNMRRLYRLNFTP